MKKKFIENWVASTKFKIYACHKNDIGTKADEDVHYHVWSVEILAQNNKLNRDSIVFNFKTIAPFIFGILNNQNLNDVLENKGKYISKEYLEYTDDVSTEPSNEVIGQLIGRLVTSKITYDNPEMFGIEVSANFDKIDNIKKNENCKNKKVRLSAETHVQYSCKEIRKQV